MKKTDKMEDIKYKRGSLIQERQKDILEIIDKKEKGATIRELTKETGRSSSQICSTLVRLRDMGYLKQNKQKGDYNYYHYEATEKGKMDPLGIRSQSMPLQQN